MVKPEETDGLAIILYLHCHTSTEISLRGLRIVIDLEEYKGQFQQAGSEKGKLFAVNCKIKSTRITDQIINANPRCGH